MYGHRLGFSKPAAFIGVRGRIKLRDRAMIPLRLAFLVVCIAGSLESDQLVYVPVLLKILLDSRMEERTINTIYKESSCSPSPLALLQSYCSFEPKSLL